MRERTHRRRAVARLLRREVREETDFLVRVNGDLAAPTLEPGKHVLSAVERERLLTEVAALPGQR